ncbi:MAG: hypothetical protein ACLQAS_08735 [Thermoplasmata archaeon]
MTNERGARRELILVVGVCTAAALVAVTAFVGPAVALGSLGIHDWVGPLSPATPPNTFPVTFSENGLPSGTNWSVSLNETTQSTVSSTIVFEEPNGTYQLYTWDVKGYMSYANLTTLHVSGAPIDITVYYNAPTAGTYFVTFVQSGLTLDVFWKVQLSAIINGTIEPGSIGQNYFGPTHTMAGEIDGVENGTFAWTAFPPSVPEWPIPAYYPFPSSGTVLVNGSSVLIHLAYRYSYPFFFDVEGLPASVSVALQIPKETTTGSGSGEYLLMIPNGTYAWNATAPGYRAESGNVTVQGLPESNVQGISFEALPSATSPPWAWIEVGVAIAVIVVGAVFLLLRRRRGGVQASEGVPTSPGSTPPRSQQPPTPP